MEDGKCLLIEMHHSCHVADDLLRVPLVLNLKCPISASLRVRSTVRLSGALALVSLAAASRSRAVPRGPQPPLCSRGRSMSPPVPGNGTRPLTQRRWRAKVQGSRDWRKDEGDGWERDRRQREREVMAEANFNLLGGSMFW